MEAALVSIVEDDADLSRALRRALMAAGFETRGFESAEAFLETYDPSRPGCILLDVRLPGDDGLCLQDRLLEMGPAPPIVFVSGHADVETAVRAMRSGAVDFLQKPFGEEELLRAVRRAVERDQEERLRRTRREGLRAKIERLTPREREVLDLLLTDLRTKQIATRLGISPRTAEIHRQRVMQKMEVDSIAALVRLLVGSGPLSDAGKPASGAAARAPRGNAPRSA